MKFLKTVSTCFKKSFDVKGVSSRSEFWFWLLFVAFLLIITTIIDGAFIAPALGFLAFDSEAGKPLSLIATLLVIIPTITAAIRRFHDSGKSGWFLLGCFVLSIVLFFVFAFLIQSYGPLITNALGGYLSAETLYLVSLAPLFYFLVKKGTRSQNPYILD